MRVAAEEAARIEYERIEFERQESQRMARQQEEFRLAAEAEERQRQEA